MRQTPAPTPLRTPTWRIWYSIFPGPAHGGRHPEAFTRRRTARPNSARRAHRPPGDAGLLGWAASHGDPPVRRPTEGPSADWIPRQYNVSELRRKTRPPAPPPAVSFAGLHPRRQHASTLPTRSASARRARPGHTCAGPANELPRSGRPGRMRLPPPSRIKRARPESFSHLAAAGKVRTEAGDSPYTGRRFSGLVKIAPSR